MQICVNMYICKYMYIYLYMYTWVFVYMYLCILMYMCMCIYIYIHAHAGPSLSNGFQEHFAASSWRCCHSRHSTRSHEPIFFIAKGFLKFRVHRGRGMKFRRLRNDILVGDLLRGLHVVPSFLKRMERNFQNHQIRFGKTYQNLFEKNKLKYWKIIKFRPHPQGNLH